MNFLVKPVFQSIHCNLHIIMRLKIKPELRLHVEKTPKPECSVGRNCAPAMHYFIYAPWGYSDIFSQPILADPHRLQEFRQKDFAWVDRGKITFSHNVTSQW